MTSKFNRPGSSTWFAYLGTGMIGAACSGTVVPQFGGGLNYGNGTGRLLLVNLNTTSGLLCSNTLAPGIDSSSQCSIGVPNDPDLIGMKWFAQAVVLGAVPAAEGGGNARLTTAIRGKIGAWY